MYHFHDATIGVRVQGGEAAEVQVLLLLQVPFIDLGVVVVLGIGINPFRDSQRQQHRPKVLLHWPNLADQFGGRAFRAFPTITAFPIAVIVRSSLRLVVLPLDQEEEQHLLVNSYR
jgi:hypothetical protein